MTKYYNRMTDEWEEKFNEEWDNLGGSSALREKLEGYTKDLMSEVSASTLGQIDDKDQYNDRNWERLHGQRRQLQRNINDLFDKVKIAVSTLQKSSIVSSCPVENAHNWNVIAQKRFMKEDAASDWCKKMGPKRVARILFKWYSKNPDQMCQTENSIKLRQWSF